LKIIYLANNFQSYSAFSSALLWTILSFVVYNTFSQLRPRYFTKYKRFISFFLALLLYFSVLYSTIHWLKFTLYIPTKPIDLNNIFNLGWLGFFVIALHIGIITLGWKTGLVAFERVIRLIPQQNKRILLYFFLSTGIITPFYFSSINIPLTILFLFSFSLPLLYDLYLEGKYSHVTWTLTWILFFTAFHTQLLYKFTLEREWAEMKIISEKLSTTSDKILERELKKIAYTDDKREQLKELFISWSKGLISNTERQSILESILHFSPYLLSYYNVNNAPEPQLNHSLKLDHNSWLVLTLKSNESNRLNHLNAGNFKGIDHLSDYSVSIFQENELLYQQGNPQSIEPKNLKNHPSNAIKKELTSKEMRYHLHKNDITVILSKKLGGYAKPLAFFSLTACFSLISYFIYIQLLRLKATKQGISNPIKMDSLGLNIQKTLFYITFSSLCILCLASLFYFDKSRKRENEREYSYLAQEIISTLQRRYHGSNHPLASIAKQHGYDFVLTDDKGNKFTSFPFNPPGGFNHSLQNKRHFSYKKEKICWKGKELLRIWFPVKNIGDKESKSMIGIYFPADDTHQNM